jgi:DNA-binding XRE family transcriptional regulator
MRFTIEDLAKGAGVERHTISRWINHLVRKKEFKRHSPGYGFSIDECKQICTLLKLNYNTIVKIKKNSNDKAQSSN